MNVESRWLGPVSYSVGLELQQEYWKGVSNGRPGILLGCEHGSVITLGKRARESVDVSLSREALEKAGVDLVWSDRGGQATLHSPGQLVIYPILSLRDEGLTVKSYICKLLKTTQALLQDLGVETRIGEDSGLHTSRGKIAFVGVRIECGCTRHGLSLNINNDLELFRWIRPCGVAQARLDNLAHLQQTPKDLFGRWVERWNSHQQESQ